MPVKKVEFDSKEDAEKVLNAMIEIIPRYGSVLMSDLYDLVGLPTTYRDTRFGWDLLVNVKVGQVNEKWIINFPPVKFINY